MVNDVNMVRRSVKHHKQQRQILLELFTRSPNDQLDFGLTVSVSV